MKLNTIERKNKKSSLVRQLVTFPKCQSSLKYTAQGSLARKKLARKIFKCVYLSFFMITNLFLKSESLLLFKLNKLMVSIGKKLAPGEHESSLKIFLCKMSLCPYKHSNKCTMAYNIFLNQADNIYFCQRFGLANVISNYQKIRVGCAGNF